MLKKGFGFAGVRMLLFKICRSALHVNRSCKNEFLEIVQIHVQSCDGGSGGKHSTGNIIKKTANRRLANSFITIFAPKLNVHSRAVSLPKARACRETLLIVFMTSCDFKHCGRPLEIVDYLRHLYWKLRYAACNAGRCITNLKKMPVF